MFLRRFLQFLSALAEKLIETYFGISLNQMSLYIIFWHSVIIRMRWETRNCHRSIGPTQCLGDSNS